MPSGAAVGDAPSGAIKSTFRPDVQGLRTIAVLAVIADHLFHWPSGGFVGVDVFFVISGFLITSLLLREHEKTGRISFVGFYRRRAKRILPIALIVIVATLTAAYFLFNEARFWQTMWDALWAALFSSNWGFAIQGTDYFGSTQAVSPLQHYWSLAVEEQFYLVWPWLMVLIFAAVLAMKGTVKHARRIILFAIVILTAASFAWSLWESDTNATWAYFSTLSRAWELGVGAILAAAAPLFTRIPGLLRTVLSWAGLVGIAASLFVVSDASGFPAPGAALPVLATAVVIGAGIGQTPKHIYLLNNRASSYIGDISYSLYLWHWPVIVFAGVLFGGSRLSYYGAVILAVATFSVVSYHFIEDPIRRSNLFESKKGNGQASPRREPISVRLKLVAIGATAVAIAGLVVAPLALDKPAAAPTDVGASCSAESDAESEVLLEDACEEIGAALALTSWPDMTPTMDEVLASDPGKIETDCHTIHRPTDPEKCVWGNPEGQFEIVLVGDSTSRAYARSFVDIATRNPDVRLTLWTFTGCRFTSVTSKGNDPYSAKLCPGRVADAIAYIQERKPDLVVITNEYGLNVQASGEEVTDEIWKSGLEDVVDQIKDSAARILFLAATPLGANPGECYTPISTPQDCESKVLSRATRERRMAIDRELADEVNGVFIDSTSFMCLEDRCPAVIADIPARFDAVHLSAAFAAHLSPLIEALLVEHGLLDAADGK